MYTLDQIKLVHGLLVHCFQVVGIGALALIGINIWYWRNKS